MSIGLNPQTCVDCARLRLATKAAGRSDRCATHQRMYRTWYQRRWKWEQRHPGETYTPYDRRLPPNTGAVTVDRAVTDELRSMSTDIASAVVTLTATFKLDISAHGAREWINALQSVSRAGRALDHLADQLEGQGRRSPWSR